MSRTDARYSFELLSDNILDIHRHLHTVIFHLINCSSQFRQVIKGYKDLQDCVSM